MDWTFEDFETELTDLVPEVRKKALEIAKKLVEFEDYTREDAIKEGIAKAEEWFYDNQG